MMANESEQREPVIVENEVKLSVQEDRIKWTDGDVLGLPEGVQVHIVNEDPSVGRRDMFVRFPSGYVEPEHSHPAAHAALILEGKMLVDGRELTAGDYVYGQREPHGPMEYPNGCVVFASFIGGSVDHEWGDDSER